MNSLNILISKLPEKLKEPVINCDSNKVLSVTMNEDYKDTNLAYLISLIAENINNKDAHYMAINLFNFHFNWMEDAYYMAFYHHWKVLELTDFQNESELKQFIGLPFEPDFNIIPEDYLNFAKERLKELK